MKNFWLNRLVDFADLLVNWAKAIDNFVDHHDPLLNDYHTYKGQWYKNEEGDL